jgi:Tfp pilus assembly PilM family ATPase
VAQRYLALDWDQNQLHLVAATISGGAVRFTRAILIADAGTPSAGQGETLGKLLRERLKEFGVSNAPVLACLGRDRLILKEIRYPQVPQHEEPGVVRFQAIKELSEAPDDVVIDYVPLPATGDGERRAQVFVARRDLVSAYQTLCQTAGLKLSGLAPRPHGMAACLRSLLGTSVLVPNPEPADAAVAIVTVGEKWAEFAILKGNSLLQTRTLTVGPGLAGEIRRNLAVHSGQQAQSPVKAVYLALSGDQSALREKLVETLEIPVHPFDPFAGAEGKDLPSSGRGTFVAAIGLLHLMARAGSLPVNFARAKQIRAPKDPNQRLYLVLTCAAFVILAGFVVGANMDLSSKAADLKEKDSELEDIAKQLQMERDKNKILLALHEWEGPPWPDEMFELSARMPPITKDFRVRVLKGIVEPEKKPSAPGVGGPRPTVQTGPPSLNSRTVARLDLQFHATTSNPIDALNADLLTSGNKNSQGAYYRSQGHTQRDKVTFDKLVYIRKRPPEQYELKKMEIKP